MRRFAGYLGALLLAGMLVLAGCDTTAMESEPPPPPTPTTGVITGQVNLPAGASGSIENTRIAIYTSYDDWANDRVMRSLGCGASGGYSFDNLTPGSYYLDAWKDNNNNQRWDSGDFVGVYGSGVYPNYQLSPLSVTAGQTTSVNLEMVIVP